MVVSRPGPSQEIIPAGLKKKQVQENTTREARENKCALSAEPTCLLPAKKTAKKTNASQKEKGAAKGKSLLSPDDPAPAGSFFPPGRRASPGSAQEILPAGLKKIKQAEKNKPQRQEKTYPDLFFLTGLGRETNNRIHVP